MQMNSASGFLHKSQYQRLQPDSGTISCPAAANKSQAKLWPHTIYGVYVLTNRI